jgi:hypothetical protein
MCTDDIGSEYQQQVYCDAIENGTGGRGRGDAKRQRIARIDSACVSDGGGRDDRVVRGEHGANRGGSERDVDGDLQRHQTERKYKPGGSGGDFVAAMQRNDLGRAR